MTSNPNNSYSSLPRCRFLDVTKRSPKKRLRGRLLLQLRPRWHHFYCPIFRIPVHFLLANLAIADITYALFYIPRIIWGHIASHPEGLAGRILCALLTDAALAWVGGASSVFTLVAVATERYYSVLHPLENKAHLSVRKLKVWYQK